MATVELKNELVNIGVSTPAIYGLVGIFGDSFVALSHFTSPPSLNEYIRGQGFAHWVQSYSLGCVRIPASLNGGVAGEATKHLLSRQAAYIAVLQAVGCKLVIVSAGTNDRTQGMDLGTSKKNIREIVRNFQNAGINVLLSSMTPRGDDIGGQSYINDHYNLHLWIESQMSKMCTVFNVWDSWVDSASGTLYFPKAEVVDSGKLHPSKIGAQLIGKVAGPKIANMSRQLGDLLESNAPYSADNITGTLTPNPLMLGSDNVPGNVNPTSGSVVASSWGIAAEDLTGIQTTWSKEIDSNGVEWQKIRIFGNSPSGECSVRMTADLGLSNIAVNDKIKATALVKSQGVGISNIALQNLILPFYSFKIDSDNSTPTLPWPSELIGPISYETPIYKLITSDNVTGFQLQFNVTMLSSSSVDATVWISKCGMFKQTY